MQGDLTGSGLRDGESGEAWGEYDPSSSGRHWGVPSKGAYAQWIDDNLIPGYTGRFRAFMHGWMRCKKPA